MPVQSAGPIASIRLVALAAAALSGTFALAFSRSDSWIEYAAGDAAVMRTGTLRAVALVKLSIAGDEGFWLRRTSIEHLHATALPQTVSLGDRITFGGPGDRQRVLEVVDIRILDRGLVPTGTAEPTSNIMIVTAQPVASDAPPLRFIIEEAGSPQRTVPRAAANKAL